MWQSLFLSKLGLFFLHGVMRDDGVIWGRISGDLLTKVRLHDVKLLQRRGGLVVDDFGGFNVCPKVVGGIVVRWIRSFW